VNGLLISRFFVKSSGLIYVTTWQNKRSLLPSQLNLANSQF